MNDFIIHPGETIHDILAERGITQEELSTRTGFDLSYIADVISGKKDISEQFAESLGSVFGVPQSFWLNLQANYDKEMKQGGRV
jgi:HTH-type transcriptional regulator/antitoxin HigA